MKKSKILLNGIINENPTFVLFLGMCPILATSSSIYSAIGMSVCVFLVLLLSNTIISLVSKFTPDEIRIPVYIIIIATIVSAISMLVEAFAPGIYSTLGAYLQLIVVNCIILGRAEAFASKNTVGASAMDAVGQSLGYGLGLLVIALIREVLGTQSLTFSNPFNAAQSVTIPLLTQFKISLFTTSAGAFITLAIVLAGIAAIQEAAKNKKAKKGDK